MIEIKCVPLSEHAKLPVKAHPSDAAFDIFTDDDVIVSSRVTVVSTGIAMEIPAGYHGKLESRSGLARDFGLQVLGAITDGAVRFGGVIDAGYRGEVKVLLATFPGMGNKAFKAGDAVAQMLILPVPDARCLWVEHLSDTERGESGFGSTDPVNDGPFIPWYHAVMPARTPPVLPEPSEEPDTTNHPTHAGRSPESTLDAQFDAPLPPEVVDWNPDR